MPESNVRVRTALTASGSGHINCVVYVEGPNGDSASGALVTIEDETNRVTMLTYDSVHCNYSAAVEEPEEFTMYAVEVTTILSDIPLIKGIPYLGAAHE
jgi:hypothetical protein